MEYLKLGLPLSLVALLSACYSGTSNNPNQPAGWIWQSGSSQSGAYGVYGTPAATPGARYIAVSWLDKQGNFWLFGGEGNAASGNSGLLNDLWQYNPTNGVWTWMSGSNNSNAYAVYGTLGESALANIPGARLGAVSWTDNAGNLWLFGGYGNATSGASGALNDLWQYNPNVGLWTWVSGGGTTNAPGVYGSLGVPAVDNIPGARLGSVGWCDSVGNLWLFGGSTDISTAQVHNDLWYYSPSSKLWTWMSGESTLNSPGKYGIQSQESSTNQPGARIDSVSWLDQQGNLWLFGGSGEDAAGTRGLLNDLWRYNSTSKLWTWMSGSNFKNSYGTYGTLGVASPNSIPGAREHRVPIAWADSGGNLWMFGGDGYGASTMGYLNDLWSYNPNNNQWMWVNGSSESNAYGTYNGATNPGARKDGVGWIDTSGHLWIFGGYGNGSTTTGILNDLWKL